MHAPDARYLTLTHSRVKRDRMHSSPMILNPFESATLAPARPSWPPGHHHLVTCGLDRQRSIELSRLDPGPCTCGGGHERTCAGLPHTDEHGEPSYGGHVCDCARRCDATAHRAGCPALLALDGPADCTCPPAHRVQ